MRERKNEREREREERERERQTERELLDFMKSVLKVGDKTIIKVYSFY